MSATRLFDCEPTGRERAELRGVNRRAQGTLFELGGEAAPVACPACGGTDDCSCAETGAVALDLFNGG